MVKFKGFSRPLSVFPVLFKVNLIFKDFSGQPCKFKYFSSLSKPCTANKRQAVGAVLELVSEAGEPTLCRFWEPSSLTLETASQATFLKPGAVFLPVAREPSSLTLETAPEWLLGA